MPVRPASRARQVFFTIALMFDRSADGDVVVALTGIIITLSSCTASCWEGRCNIQAREDDGDGDGDGDGNDDGDGSHDACTGAFLLTELLAFLALAMWLIKFLALLTSTLFLNRSLSPCVASWKDLIQALASLLITARFWKWSERCWRWFQRGGQVQILARGHGPDSG